MPFRHTRLLVAAGVLVALWSASTVRQSDRRVWVHPEGTGPAPVRILRFYANVGTLQPGEKALLCYGVENARSVRIAPAIPDVYPSTSHCLEIGPEHTTHYTILAEGFDGKVATQSLTLPVQKAPVPPFPLNLVKTPALPSHFLPASCEL
jgi:hypothetical protein